MRLRELGMKKFLVINLPNLGLTPMVLHNDSFLISRNYADDQARLMEFSFRLAELTQWHNDALSDMVERFRKASSDVEIFLVDTNALFEQVANPAVGAHAMGFDLESSKVILSSEGHRSEFQDRCYSGMTLGLFASTAEVCRGASRAVFWDLVHPSTFFHCWIAFWIGNVLHQQDWTAPMADMPDYRAWCEMIADAY